MPTTRTPKSHYPAANRWQKARERRVLAREGHTCSTESRSAPGAPSAFTIHLSRSVCPTQPRPRPTPKSTPASSNSLRPSRLGEAHPAIRSVPLVILTMLLFGMDIRFENQNLRSDRVRFDSIVSSFCPFYPVSRSSEIICYRGLILMRRRLNNFDVILRG